MTCVVNPDGTITCPEPNVVAVVQALGIQSGTVVTTTAAKLGDSVRIRADQSGVPMIAILLPAADVGAAIKQLSSRAT